MTDRPHGGGCPCGPCRGQRAFDRWRIWQQIDAAKRNEPPPPDPEPDPGPEQPSLFDLFNRRKPA